MKRTLTVLLTACLIFQSWAGAATPVHGASYLAQQDAAGKAGADDESQDVQTDALGTGISENDEPGAVGTDASENDGLDNFDTDSFRRQRARRLRHRWFRNRWAETDGTDAGNADAQESGVFAAEEGTDTEAESALEVEVRKSEKFPFQGSVKVQVRGGRQRMRSRIWNLVKTARRQQGLCSRQGIIRSPYRQRGLQSIHRPFL